METDNWNYEDATDEELDIMMTDTKCKDCGTELDIKGCPLCDGRVP